MKNILSLAILHNGFGIIAMSLIAKLLDEHPTPVPPKPYRSADYLQY